MTDLEISDETLRLPDTVDPSATYDVLLNDSHVWSLRPERDALRKGDALIASWPKAVSRYLRGRATVTLRHHVTGETVGAGSHVFAGDDSREVDVVDKFGAHLVLDKYGRLTRPLSAAGDELEELLDETEKLLRALNERAGVAAFIAYGTLLGAVRNGELIGHDNDIDIAYLSEKPHPVDVIRETFRVERLLQEEGWSVRRGSGTRLNVRVRLANGEMRFVDVFTAHWVDDVLFMPADTGFKLPRETMLPLTTVQLHGRSMPAPADYERLLAATYGENWRTPDPSFKYATPRWLARRLGGWFGGLHPGRKFWDAFYGGPGKDLPHSASPFALWVAEHYPSQRHLIDVGAGNARDARYFARTHGRPVTAIDYSVGVLNRISQRPKVQDLPIQFAAVNLYDAREVLSLGARLSREPEPVDLYARFTLHALEPEGRTNLMRLASMSLRTGGHLFLEFRTPKDKGKPHHFQGKGGRMYVDPDEAVALVEAHGGTVVEHYSGKGLAPFEEEDPDVCRMVASWSG